MDHKNPYETSPADSTSSSTFYGLTANRKSNFTSSSYSDPKDVVTADDAAPPPYTQYPTEQPRQPRPQYQSLPIRQSQPQPQQQSQRQYQSTQYQSAPTREYHSTQYQPAAQSQPLAQAAAQTAQCTEYRYQMDLPQDYNGSYGYARRGRRGMRRGRRIGGGPLHMLMESRQQASQRPGHGCGDETVYGRVRRGRRESGGPLHMLIGEAMKRF